MRLYKHVVSEICIWVAVMGNREKNVLVGSFRHWYSPSIEIFLESRYKLIQTSKLEFGHALLSTPATFDAGAQLVLRGHHHLMRYIGMEKIDHAWINECAKWMAKHPLRFLDDVG